MATYDRGDVVRLAATFRDITGAVIDPSVIEFKAILPDKSTFTRIYGAATPNDDIKRSGAGSYYIDFYIAQGGRYGYQWRGDGAATATAEGGFFARDEVAFGN